MPKYTVHPWGDRFQVLHGVRTVMTLATYADAASVASRLNRRPNTLDELAATACGISVEDAGDAVLAEEWASKGRG